MLKNIVHFYHYSFPVTDQRDSEHCYPANGNGRVYVTGAACQVTVLHPYLIASLRQGDLL